MAVGRLRAVWNWFVFFVLYVALTWPVIQAMIKETGYFKKSLRSTLALSDRVFLKQFFDLILERRGAWPSKAAVAQQQPSNSRHVPEVISD